MQEWSKDEIKALIEKEEDVYLYLYTPMCGTCEVAGKMTTVTAELLPRLQWGKCNLNYIPEYAAMWEIESVPCLLVFHKKQIHKKIYAFHSVPYLYETLKKCQQ